MATDAKHHADQSIWKIDFNDLAKQICLKDMELFKAISIEELNSFNWSKANKKALCPNLMISNKQFNKINLWVQKEILDQKISMIGIKVLSRFIKLSKRLLDHRNFQSAYAVKSALHSTPIFRLEYLWSEISKKDKLTWERLSFIFDVENNYNNLRNVMSEKKRPAIPFLGVYLCDLTGLDAAYPKIDDIESGPRKMGMEKVYNSIRYFQSSKYDFKSHPGIQDYLHSMEYMEEFQNYIIDTLFNLSKALEPDSNGHRSTNSSQSSNCLSPQSPMNRNNQFRPSHRKCQSLETNDCARQGSYRKISENERQSAFFPHSPDSSKSVINDMDESSAIPISTIRNLLDDSVVELQPDTPLGDIYKENPGGQNGSVRGISPTLNDAFKWEDSEENVDIETISVVQYKDPDVLSIGRNWKLIAEGSVKRKIKSKSSTFCMPSYQKVLARLFINNVDCFLNFFTPKIPKPKSVADFREEPYIKVSLCDAELEYKKFSSSPKILIYLPHETYILKSVDDVPEDWLSIESWWQTINESIDSAKCARASKSQPKHNLIDLEIEFTRL